MRMIVNAFEIVMRNTIKHCDILVFSEFQKVVGVLNTNETLDMITLSHDLL